MAWHNLVSLPYWYGLQCARPLERKDARIIGRINIEDAYRRCITEYPSGIKAGSFDFLPRFKMPAPPFEEAEETTFRIYRQRFILIDWRDDSGGRENQIALDEREGRDVSDFLKTDLVMLNYEGRLHFGIEKDAV